MARELVNFDKLNLLDEFSTSLAESAYRECTLTCTVEEIVVRIVVHDVVAFRKTEFKDVDFYEFEGKLVDLGETDWLEFIRVRLANSGPCDPDPKRLRHFLVNFYEGPSYEFICYKASLTIDDPLDRTRGGKKQQITDIV